MYKVKFQPGFRQQLRQLQSPDLVLAIRRISTELSTDPIVNAQQITLDIGHVYIRDVGANLQLVYRVYQVEEIVLIMRLI